MRHAYSIVTRSADRRYRTGYRYWSRIAVAESPALAMRSITLTERETVCEVVQTSRRVGTRPASEFEQGRHPLHGYQEPVSGMVTAPPAPVQLATFDAHDLGNPLGVDCRTVTVGIRSITFHAGSAEFRVRDASALGYLRRAAAQAGQTTCTVRIARRYIRVPACRWCHARPAMDAVGACNSPQCRAGRSA